MKTFVAVLALLLGGCVGMPDTVRPVDNFQLERYLGTWYEIARLDHPFERGLSRVSAEYSLREDGGVQVINRGYSAEKGAWKQARGKGYFVQDPQTGYLKVSFFGPFYGSYVIFELDHEGYRYAVVSGPDTSYLWILAREPFMDESLKADLVDRAAKRGFDTDGLIFVEHP
ncbi:MAG: lipocalin [Deltaproteobacteria bacterium HGW-Deltaproteobacteria-18]|jgi:apolipoprotein D and lipocalin family protein|nr:MAG: lipocalin [Deltaproteobacteria bacterium HGW-Deltaproteobacteria-18]